MPKSSDTLATKVTLMLLGSKLHLLQVVFFVHDIEIDCVLIVIVDTAGDRIGRESITRCFYPYTSCQVIDATPLFRSPTTFLNTRGVKSYIETCVNTFMLQY